MSDQVCLSKREFTYKSEKRLFVRHLKVGNCEFCDNPAVVWYDNPYCEDHAEEYADGYIRD